MEEIWDLQIQQSSISRLIEKHAQSEHECAVAMTFFRTCWHLKATFRRYWSRLWKYINFCFFTRSKIYLGQSGGAFHYFLANVRNRFWKDFRSMVSEPLAYLLFNIFSEVKIARSVVLLPWFKRGYIFVTFEGQLFEKGTIFQGDS